MTLIQLLAYKYSTELQWHDVIKINNLKYGQNQPWKLFNDYFQAQQKNGYLITQVIQKLRN